MLLRELDEVGVDDAFIISGAADFWSGRIGDGTPRMRTDIPHRKAEARESLTTK